jgi:hypothetical protein
MEDNDYLQSLPVVTDDINNLLRNIDKIILVVHSYAAFYANNININMIKLYL